MGFLSDHGLIQERADFPLHGFLVALDVLPTGTGEKRSFGHRGNTNPSPALLRHSAPSMGQPKNGGHGSLAALQGLTAECRNLNFGLFLPQKERSMAFFEENMMRNQLGGA